MFPTDTMVMLWTSNSSDRRYANYTQIMVFPGCMMTEADLVDFQSFMTVAVRAKHPAVPIGCVQTRDGEDRWDFMFFVHDDDAANWDFCTSRLRYGLRWLSDVVGNESKDKYPKDFCTAYITA